MTDLTQEQIEKLARLAEAATPGPWLKAYLGKVVTGVFKDGCRHVNGVHEHRSDVEYTAYRPADDLFVAAANPTTVKALIAMIKDRDAEIEQWKSLHDSDEVCIQSLYAEINAMRPVVEAVGPVCKGVLKKHCSPEFAALLDAHSAYEAKMKEVGDVAAD